MQEQKEGKKRVSLSVHEAVTEYVNNKKWDTLVGKSFHTGNQESRDEFIEFLTKHIHAVMDVGQEMKKAKSV
jgi:hypothetical protein